MGGGSKYEIGFITITWDITKKKKTYSSMFIWKVIFNSWIARMRKSEL